jgi:SOS response regulatory protein OraA/RecX
MDDSTIDTVRQLLNGALDETDDAEVHFKLRTALQLLSVVEERDQQLKQDLKEAAFSEDTLARLREQGYLD